MLEQPVLSICGVKVVAPPVLNSKDRSLITAVSLWQQIKTSAKWRLGKIIIHAFVSTFMYVIPQSKSNSVMPHCLEIISFI